MKHTLRSLALSALVLLLLVISGCAAQRQVNEGTMDRSARAMATAAPAKSLAPAAPNAATAEADAALPERKIILTASLQLVVQDTDRTVGAIKDLVAGWGGYVASANVWQAGNVLHGRLAVRVPADKLEPFLAEVKKLATRVEREESGGQDVTEEYVDIEAQLTNLEAAEKELRELLTSVREKTGKAEDVMAVYRELTNIRGQIDRLKGRQQYLDRMTAMATVNLELNERQPEPIGKPGWQPLETLRSALSTLVQAAKLVVDLLIWIAAFLVPLLIVPVAALWLLWYLTKRRRARRGPGATSPGA